MPRSAVVLPTGASIEWARAGRPGGEDQAVERDASTVRSASNALTSDSRNRR